MSLLGLSPYSSSKRGFERGLKIAPSVQIKLKCRTVSLKLKLVKHRKFRYLSTNLLELGIVKYAILISNTDIVILYISPDIQFWYFFFCLCVVERVTDIRYEIVNLAFSIQL